VVFGNVITIESRGVVGFDDAQTIRILRFQWSAAAVDVIEDAELDDGAISR
jgi:hypothetical protein